MKTLLLVVVLCSIASEAAAMTGAEFTQEERNFAIGYAYGVVEYKIGVLDTDDPNFMKVRNCVLAAGINGETVYEITIERLKRHPEELATPAFGAILNVLSEMCTKK